MDKKNRLPVFKERFEKLFEESGVSQTEFANRLGLSRQTVGFYLNGDRIPDAEGVLSLAKSCSVSSDWLLGLSDSRSFDENIQIAVKTTGLSQSATEALVKLKESEYAPILSALFESSHFKKMIELIYAALWCKKSVSRRATEEPEEPEEPLLRAFSEYNQAAISDAAERILRTFSNYSDEFVIVPRSAQITSYLQDAQAEMLEATKDAIESIEKTQAMDAVLTKMAKIEYQALRDEYSNVTVPD